jgi:hypothetical protein
MSLIVPLEVEDPNPEEESEQPTLGNENPHKDKGIPWRNLEIINE